MIRARRVSPSSSPRSLQRKKAKKAKKPMKTVTDKDLLATIFEGEALAAALGRDMETEVTPPKIIISHGYLPLGGLDEL